nr:immunoglobulin heavy chain junction region [Macaca mulatta]
CARDDGSYLPWYFDIW